MGKKTGLFFFFFPRFILGSCKCFFFFVSMLSFFFFFSCYFFLLSLFVLEYMCRPFSLAFFFVCPHGCVHHVISCIFFLSRVSFGWVIWI